MRTYRRCFIARRLCDEAIPKLLETHLKPRRPKVNPKFEISVKVHTFAHVLYNHYL